MAYRYDRPTEGYTQKIPPGVHALRSEIARMFGLTRTEVIRNLSRCQQQSSEHCVCRGIDFFTTNLVLGRRIFDLLVSHADALGVQSVIFNNRQWGFGLWYERGDPSSPHLDHVHVGMNRWAAANLTVAMIRAALDQEDDMTAEDWKKLDEKFAQVLGHAKEAHGWAQVAVEGVQKLEARIPEGVIGAIADAVVERLPADVGATKEEIAEAVADEIYRRGEN